VLQRRSATKDTWPGKLDVAVGGHVRAGESVADTLREAEEELGLALAPSEVVRIGLRHTDVRSQPGVVDVELQEIFAALVPVPLTAFALHPEEVDAVVRLPLTDARALLVERMPVEVAIYERGATDEAAAVVSGDDVLPDEDGYYGAALDALAALCDGRSPVPFTVRRSAA
jgi:8-oxo-dGTP pyrophosphatase MutT (NUDIX family)